MRALSFFWAVTVLWGCTPRSYNSAHPATQITIWHSDDTSETIDVVATGKEYYAPAQLRAEYGRALFGGLKDASFGKQNVLSFIAEPYANRLSEGTLEPDNLSAEILPIEPEDARLLYFIQQSEKRIVNLLGAAFLHGDIFAEGNYRKRVWFGDSAQHSTLTGLAPIKSLDELLKKQAWLQWLSAEKKFQYKTTGAQENILKNLYAILGASNTISLYRGGGVNERFTSDNRTIPYAIDPKDVPFYFTTTDLAAAKRFASPIVYRAEIDRATLLEIASREKPSVYVGLEYEYPEIGFFSVPDEDNLWEKHAVAFCKVPRAGGDSTSTLPACL